MIKNIVLCAIFIVVLSDCSDEITDEGAFTDTQRISVSHPDDGSEISMTETDFYLSWSEADGLGFQSSAYTAVAVFSEEPQISDHTIKNMNFCVGGLRQGVSPFTEGRVELDYLKRYDSDVKDFTTGPVSLSSGNRYYWLVWRIDEYGNIGESSLVHSFSVEKEKY